MPPEQKMLTSDMVSVPIHLECPKQQVPKKLAELNRKLDENLRRGSYWHALERHKLTITGILLCMTICLCFLAAMIYISPQPDVVISLKESFNADDKVEDVKQGSPNGSSEKIARREQFQLEDSGKSFGLHDNPNTAGNMMLERLKRETGENESSCKMRAEHCKALLDSMSTIVGIINDNKAYIDNISKNLTKSRRNSTLRDIIDCLVCAKRDSTEDNRLTDSVESNHVDEQLSNDHPSKVEIEKEANTVNGFLDNGLKVKNIERWETIYDDRGNETVGEQESKGFDVSKNDYGDVSATPNDEERNKAVVRSIDANEDISENHVKEEQDVKKTSTDAGGHDVTITINKKALYPSAYPSNEGRAEAKAGTLANESESKEKESAAAKVSENLKGRVMNKYEQRGNIDQNQALIPTAETIKSSQQLQLTPTMSWMPYPVCFYGPPQASGTKQSSTGQVIFPPSSPAAQFPVSMPQHRGIFSSGRQQGSTLPNYVQVQAQSVQFMPMQQFSGSQGGQRVGLISPTGQAIQTMPIYSGNLPTGPGATARAPYFCTYIPAPTFQFPAIPGVTEYQRSAAENNSENARSLYPYDSWNMKEPLFPEYPRICPSHSYSCADNSRCIKKQQRCDGHVDCPDASDETTCTCRDRIARERICDGYFDCPYGEDELGCFGCSQNTFNCGDWKRQYTTENCVLLSQRCDGIRQCPNGRDEMDCTILTDSYMEGKDMFTVGYTSGYLHKNYQGQWYPACTGTKSWVFDACASEIGAGMNGEPEIEVHGIPENTYKGSYLIEVNNEIKVVPTCMNTTIFVRCPPIPCGTNVLSRIEYYPHHNVLEDAVMRRSLESMADDDETAFENVYVETNKLLDQTWKTDSNDTDSIVGVVGGRASKPKAWPFLVAIYKNGNFHCGGVIVNEYWILTAAHCLDGYSNYYYEVQAGMLRRFSFSPMAQIRQAKYVIMHPEYDGRIMTNDLGMILLDEQLRFNRWIRPACLPEVDTAGPMWRQGPSADTTCITIGWGAVREHGPDPDHLREVEVPILSHCTHMADQNDAVICAGYRQGGYDACQGDSGGPLMCRNPTSPSQWYTAGIVSHGEGCARPNEPGAYTKVSHFVDWIENISRGQVIPPFERLPLDRCPGFSCEGGLGKCLPIERRCDRTIDCLDGEDEINCPWQRNLDLFKEVDENEEIVSSVRGRSEKGTNFTKLASDWKMKENLIETTRNVINAAASPTTLSPPLSSSKFEGGKVLDFPTSAVDTTTSQITTATLPLTFTCDELMQSIPMSNRCDKVIDCEDGTDETDCTCKDYLLNSQPSAICNGQIDCADLTDEDNCQICKADEFLCGRSKTCIPSKRKCDGEFDCPLMEDEIDCMTLSNGEYVITDVDERPQLNIEGVLTRYTNAHWRPTCHRSIMYQNESTATLVGENVCQYLGFASLETVEEISVRDADLSIISLGDEKRTQGTQTRIPETGRYDKMCPGLYVRCRPVLNSVVNAHLAVDPSTGSRTYLWPWTAAIFVDGRYRCAAILLESDWLLSSSKCIEDVSLSEKCTMALFGQSSSYLHADGPYEQISIVDAIKLVKHSEAALLHLKKPVNMTRHVQPIFLEKKIYPALKRDSCIAIGTDGNHVTKSVFVQPLLENCQKCHRCFVNKTLEKCTRNETSEWSGAIFCLGPKGWYPSAVFDEKNGSCSFRTPKTLTSIDYINAYLTEAMEDDVEPFDEPKCDGVRCKLGECVNWNKVCDGIKDCRDGDDENAEFCVLRKQLCSNELNGCKCAKSEMRCGNGQCVSKSAFCNGEVECSDGTDEPASCSCAEYLKMTAPGRICDGIRHCLDKSDESPDVCLCKDSSFKCQTENDTCVPWDFVCDGENDCPQGEDEEDCRRVKGSLKDPPGTGEVMRRSYGVWHSDCLQKPVTSQEEASDLCKLFGYQSGNPLTEITNSSAPLVPSHDNFYLVRLNPDFWMSVRKDKPMVTLVPPTGTCYRAFVSCS